ncbi:MAG: hypothetical protein ACI8RZ_005383, partial [Myxococcota bacterium]
MRTALDRIEKREQSVEPLQSWSSLSGMPFGCPTNPATTA